MVKHLEKTCKVFEVTPEKLIKNDSIILSNNQQGGNSTNAFVINQLSEKLIEQYELRLKEKDELIKELKNNLE